jgi:hypothetical protein
MPAPHRLKGDILWQHPASLHQPSVEKKATPVNEPKPVGVKQRVQDLLVAIFEGHEEFLGWTPD